MTKGRATRKDRKLSNDLSLLLTLLMILDKEDMEMNPLRQTGKPARLPQAPSLGTSTSSAASQGTCIPPRSTTWPSALPAKC